MPDRLTDLKLPDNSTSQENDGAIKETFQQNGEEDDEKAPGYSLEEKAKLQSVINLMTSNTGATDQKNKARAQNEKMKLMGEQMMEPDK